MSGTAKDAVTRRPAEPTAYPAVPDIGFLSYGRLRLLHTNEVAYGFLVNAFLGMLYYVVPRITGRAVANAKLGWFILVVWQLCTVLTSVGQILGKAWMTALAVAALIPLRKKLRAA